MDAITLLKTDHGKMRELTILGVIARFLRTHRIAPVQRMSPRGAASMVGRSLRRT